MDIQGLLETTGAWLARHALNLGLIIGATCLVLWLVAVLNRKLVNRLFKERPDEASQKMAQTIVAAVRWTLFLAILAVAVVMILGEVGGNTGFILNMALAWLMTRGLGVVLIVAIAFVALKATGLLTTRLLVLIGKDQQDVEAQKRAETLSSVIRWVVRTAILVVTAVMVLSQLGVQVGPVIAAAGVVGLAVGFGAQNLVADIISGFFILLEDQVRVGDVVQLDGRAGLVERITLRLIILRDVAGNVHYVRNGKIDVVTNMTKDYSRYVFDIGVAYRENVDEVIKVIQAVDEDLRKDPAFRDDILQPIEVLGLDKFDNSAVVIKARTTTKPIKQWRVGREFNRRLKQKFDEVGIEIPFPHLTLYPGKDKQGNSPTLKLEIEGPGKPPSGPTGT
jgi:small conductance mechanosensitive channel